MADILKAVDIAKTAADLVGGPRNHVHGDMLVNHQKIAAVWNGILTAAGKAGAAPLDAHDVATLMEGLKIARRYLGSFNRDDFVDGAGYAACAGEIRSRLINQAGETPNGPRDSVPAGTAGE